jgi:hypothetical protein
LTQYLTPAEGKPELKRLLEGVMLLMRMSATWDEFKLKLDEWYPRFDDTMQLPFSSGVYALPAPTLNRAAAQGAGGGGERAGSSGGGSGSSGDDVVDAEFEEVDPRDRKAS